MIVTFTPTEGDSRAYEFKPRLLPNRDAELLEKLTGKSYQTFVQDATSGNALARRALVFMFEKRTHPTLKWDAFDFPYGAVEVEYDRDEYAAMREAIEADKSLDDEERAPIVAQLREFEESAPEVPKAPAPSAVSDS